MTLSAVRIDRVAPLTTAVVRGRAAQRDLSRVIPAACGEVWTYARQAKLVSPGRHVAVYLDGGINYECGVEVGAPFTGTDRIVCSTTPSGTVATVTLWGPYSGLGAAHEAIRRWCETNGHRLAGPNWEIYGHWIDDQAKLQTDVAYLLEEVALS